MKILLLMPPVQAEERGGKLAHASAVMPSLGILYLAAVLREKKHEVSILDAEVCKLSVNQTVSEIEKQAPDILGITATTLLIDKALQVAEKARAKLSGLKIFIGGPHVTALAEETMSKAPYVDACFIGDSEISFPGALDNLEKGKKFHENINGICYREDGKIFLSEKTEHFSDLDSLPFPAWDLLEGFPQKYRPPVHSYRQLPVTNIVTTRGCPMACTFCDRSVFGKKLHRHSIKYVCDMIEKLINDFGVREISIKDDMFTISPQRVIEFCDELEKRKIKITWSCNARVNSVNDEMLRAMKKAGCFLISYGIESGSEKMLEKMDKRISLEEIVTALTLTRKNGICSKGFFMLGIPGETEETIKETLLFVKKLPLDELSINFFTPFPGTQLYREVLDEGFKPDFTEMNMRNAVYCPSTINRDELSKSIKKFVYSFYLRPGKLTGYGIRALTNYYEFLRFIRMSRAFLRSLF